MVGGGRFALDLDRLILYDCSKHERERERERQTDRQTDRQTETETDRDLSLIHI